MKNNEQQQHTNIAKMNDLNMNEAIYSSVVCIMFGCGDGNTMAIVLLFLLLFLLSLLLLLSLSDEQHASFMLHCNIKCQHVWCIPIHRTHSLSRTQTHTLHLRTFNCILLFTEAHQPDNIHHHTLCVSHINIYMINFYWCKT